MLSATTPSQLRHSAVRVALVAATFAVLLILAWGFRLEVMAVRPQLLMMLYMLALGVAAGAGVVAGIAHCHAAVHRAFRAGVAVGQAQLSEQARADVEALTRPVLRVVE